MILSLDSLNEYHFRGSQVVDFRKSQWNMRIHIFIGVALLYRFPSSRTTKLISTCLHDIDNYFRALLSGGFFTRPGDFFLLSF
jgi:Holliday junction resolvase RusA-like endonuclease